MGSVKCILNWNFAMVMTYISSSCGFHPTFLKPNLPKERERAIWRIFFYLVILANRISAKRGVKLAFPANVNYRGFNFRNEYSSPCHHQFNFFLIKKTMTKDEINCDNVKWKM